ncbi:MAG: lysyl-tRNA synthetase, class [Actinomycetota bacterium]|nr:lysyl-tRNA synthetase, class [Actinomycetota bacterium]
MTDAAASGACPSCEHPSSDAGVPDLIEVDLDAGTRALVVSDLHLEKDPTRSSTSVTTELGAVLDDWEGPGVVVFAGDMIELLATTANSPQRALAAHPRLASAAARFAATPGRRVICLVGNHDAQLAWDRRAAGQLREGIGAELALAAELRFETGRGRRRVRVEHGHQLDPANSFVDPRNPGETPFGHHLVREVLPNLKDQAWLQGWADLADAGRMPAFVTSRLAYRGVLRHLWWLLVPLALALAVKLPLLYTLLADLGNHSGAPAWSGRILMVAGAVVADVVLVGGGLVLVARRAWRAVSGMLEATRGHGNNDAARALAGRLVAEGYAGLITGHTHRPELSLLGDGFYVNTGCGSEAVAEWPSRLGLPSVFLAHRQLSWVELEPGADLHVRLFQGRRDLPGGTRLERLLARRPKMTDARPELVATYPQGPSWPQVADPLARDRRRRRIAAAAIAVAGLVDLTSAFTAPLRFRLQALLRLMPLAVPEAAGALTALCGLALLILARGVRRGQRRAWRISLTLLAASVVLHLTKGVDLEEAVVAAVVGLYLLRQRRAFRCQSEPASLGRGLLAVAGAASGVIVLGTLVVKVAGGAAPSAGQAVMAVAQRLVGLNGRRLPDRPLDDFLTPALGAVGVGLLAYAGWALLRPVVAGRHGGQDLPRAREVVAAHGRDTLAYFALRSDKRHFFWGDGVVAYALYGGVCLVSPDPIGPVTERERLWEEFRRFADHQSWTIAVLGAGEEWLPVYRKAAMNCRYVGDEAVVNCQRFNLDGGRSKGLRQAVNRIARNGYRVDFHDPATLGPELRESLLEVMTKSRRGDVERGFSMTLGRVFEPDDTGLLLAVCWGPGPGAEDGSEAASRPVAFCQFVPAPGIDGYSLDLMRRDDGEHPNGITDFVVVETIRHLRQLGLSGLGLNFATMRAVIAGEFGDGLGQRSQRWLLRQMSDSMQIESLWRFAAKFDPDWQPRYAVYDGSEHVLPGAIAVARAESFWELPVIGRFFKPAGDRVPVP